MRESSYGDLSIIAMRGCEDFVSQVDAYVQEWRRHDSEGTYIAEASCPRFGSGEGKGLIQDSMRNRDVYIISDVFNHGVTYTMYEKTVPMSPDDHFQDLKRIISAIAGKAKRITVLMPMLYEGRQHKRSSRESLDCAMALQELHAMGVSNIITFDVHDPRVQNAIPLCGFDNFRSTYQMIKALVHEYPDITFEKEKLMIVSPDEGAMSRCMYYSSMLGLELGMFYKRRNYSVIINGKNPIEAHEYLGQDPAGMDVIIVDDMISSGESMIDVAKQLKARGANRIFIFTAFGLFCNGLGMIDEAYEQGMFTRIMTTNLIYRTPELLQRKWYHEVNMCKYVAYIIDTLNHDQSVAGLLDQSKRIRKLIADHTKGLR